MTPVELVCFPNAGGGSASFHALRRAMAAMGVEVTLTTVKLPGRESRYGEPRYVDADTCVRGLADDHFLAREPDPELVVAVARIVEDVALERI